MKSVSKALSISIVFIMISGFAMNSSPQSRNSIPPTNSADPTDLNSPLRRNDMSDPDGGGEHESPEVRALQRQQFAKRNLARQQEIVKDTARLVQLTKKCTPRSSKIKIRAMGLARVLSKRLLRSRSWQRA